MKIGTSLLFDYVLSPFYDRLAGFWPSRVHPNFITILGGAFAHASSLAMDEARFGQALVLWTLYTICDNTDGKHARRTKQCSRFGAFLDHAVDGTCGLHAGFQAVAIHTFGVHVSSAEHWSLRHAVFCIWLAPHVNSHFTGTLSLGNKLVSIDEGFLIVAIILGIRAWVSTPLFPLSIVDQHIMTNTFLVSALAWVSCTCLYSLLCSPVQFHAKACFCVVGYAAFWSLVHTTHGIAWWLYWIPTMAAIIWSA